MIMNREKLKGYESPTTQIIDLHIDDSILTVSGPNAVIMNATLMDSWGDL